MKDTLHAIGLSLGAAAAAIALACDSSPPTDSTSAPAATAESASAPTRGPISYDELVALLREPEPFAKARMLGELLPTLGPDSLPAVQEVLEESAHLELSGLEYELLIRFWAQYDAPGAAFHALGSSPPMFRVAAIYATLRPWAQADPHAAVQDARPFAIDSGDPGAAAQIALVRGWYESGKPGLLEYIRDLGAGFERQRALLAYANAVIRQDGVDTLVKWAESVPETSEGDMGGTTYRLEVFRNVGAALVAHDVDAAKAFCDRHCEGPHGSNLRSRIARRWARRDPAAALEWLGTAPKNQETQLSTRVAYAVWVAEDKEGAIAWMKRKLADNAEWVRPTLPVYARWLGKDSPVEAIGVAETISDPKERDIVKLDIVRAWRLKDEAAAEAWLADKRFSPEALDKIRAPETQIERLEREKAAKDALAAQRAAKHAAAPRG